MSTEMDGHDAAAARWRDTVQPGDTTSGQVPLPEVAERALRLLAVEAAPATVAGMSIMLRNVIQPEAATAHYRRQHKARPALARQVEIGYRELARDALDLLARQRRAVVTTDAHGHDAWAAAGRPVAPGGAAAPTRTGGGTRCATYTRTSSDDSDAYSLDSQAREARELACRRGYEIVAEFTDDGVSGALLDRPALTRLRDGVRAGQYHVVLVARVEFVTTPAEDTAEGRLLLNVSGVIAEFEREKIRERTARGKVQKARQGLYVQPRAAPFGYRPDPARPGHLVIQEPEADTVRLIFRLCVDGKKSVRGIVAELRRLGIRSARGRWTCMQVRRVLTRGYAGTRFFNREQMTPDGRGRVRARDACIAISVPAIVTPEREAAARIQLDRNRLTRVGRPPSAFYLLRGLLNCSTCGCRYRGSALRGRRTYRHANGDRALECPAHTLSFGADALEADVRAAVAAALSDATVLRQAVEAYELRRAATDVELRSRVSYLARQIEKIRTDERRLIALVVGDREQADIVETRLAELAQRRAGLAMQLRDAEGQVARHGAVTDPTRIEAIVARARRSLGKLDREGWRALLAEVVDEVAVLPDRAIEIRGLISGGILGHPPRLECTASSATSLSSSPSTPSR
jgi:site-specific DNA recombinase